MGPLGDVGVGPVCHGVAGMVDAEGHFWAGAIYNGGFILGIKAFTAAVLGGIGNIRGALLGGLLLGVIGNYGAIILGQSDWTDVVCFVVLVMVLFGVVYLLLSDPVGNARLGDRRTLADLSGPAPAKPATVDRTARRRGARG